LEVVHELTLYLSVKKAIAQKMTPEVEDLRRRILLHAAAVHSPTSKQGRRLP
jgi:hypothetical protein